MFTHLTATGVSTNEGLVAPGATALFKLLHQTAGVVEVAKARVAIEQDGDGSGVAHELDDFEHLCPTGLVVVADAEGGGDGQAASPDPFEAGFLDDRGAQAIVGFHEEFQAVGLQQPSKLGGFLHQ